MSIPKIVHYCWFGRAEKPRRVKDCILSWKQYLPDYTFMEWNEGNFDVNELLYTEQAYSLKKYAFVSDVARVKALYQYGGIYMDTDVEVIKSFNDILSHRVVMGIEEGNFVATSFIAAEKRHSLIFEFMNLYEEINFIDNNGNIIPGTNVTKLTEILKKKGFEQKNKYQELEGGICIYPKEYFSPYDYINCYMAMTENTYCVHYFYVSWMPWKIRLKKMIKRRLVNIIGINGMNSLREKMKK